MIGNKHLCKCMRVNFQSHVITKGKFNGVKDVRFWAGILVLTLVILYIIF